MSPSCILGARMRLTQTHCSRHRCLVAPLIDCAASRVTLRPLTGSGFAPGSVSAASPGSGPGPGPRPQTPDPGLQALATRTGLPPIPGRCYDAVVHGPGPRTGLPFIVGGGGDGDGGGNGVVPYPW